MRDALRPVLLVLLGIYLFVYPWGILLIALRLVPVWGTWMGGMLLIIQGTLMGLWLVANYGRRGGLAALLILLLSWGVEHIGVTTGFPFGSYSYTNALNLKILGVVPMAVPFAWLLVIPAATGIMDHLMHSRSLQANSPHILPLYPASPFLLSVLGTASFALMLDLLIEPMAVHINSYWIWNNPHGSYYGVPGSNFTAWWATSVVLASLMQVMIRPTPADITSSIAIKHHGRTFRFSPFRFSRSALRVPLFPFHTLASRAPLLAFCFSLSPFRFSRSALRVPLFPFHTLASRFSLLTSRFPLLSSSSHMHSIYPWLPPLLYMLNLVMFVLITLAHGQLLAAVIGSGLLLYLSLGWLEPHLVDWIMGESQARATSPDQTPG